jgi:transketolase
MNINPKKPDWEDRDRFILSKGHAGAALYSVLARSGYFPVSMLDSFCQEDSRLIVHPELNGLPGIEHGTGSLGHGLSVATGLAFGLKKINSKAKVYTLISDAESNEGSIWEAALFAGHHHLDNLTVILDYNNSQGLGKSRDILNLEPLDKKWQAFNFNVQIIDGHNPEELQKAFNNKANNSNPNIIIAKTVIGKGVSFMENDYRWHYYDPKLPQLDSALKEINFIKV